MHRKMYSFGKLSISGEIFVNLLLFLASLFFLLPVVWMVTTSLKDMGSVYIIPPKWIPSPVQWDNYKQIFVEQPFVKFIWNTAWYTLVCVFATTFSSSMVAYAFARLWARGRKMLFLIVLSTMMLPPQVTMIPQYLLFKNFGWLDTYWPLIIPAFGSSAFTIFLLRQFYLGISRELDEAIKVDGGGYWLIYIRIILPLSIPAMITAAIMELMYRWNDLIGPLIYLNTTEKYPISLALAFFSANHGGTQWNLLMAASVVAVLPLLLLFFFAQKYFIQGIVISGSKG